METQAAKARRLPVLGAVLLGLVALLGLAPNAEATRTLPSALSAALEPGPPAAAEVLEALEDPQALDQTYAVFDEADLSLLAALSLFDASEIEQANAENRFRLFADSSEIPPLVERVWRRKTALGASTGVWECNVWAPRGLAHVCVDLFFQGAWTDPTTGIAYHRNRWYDPRTANWLSEDPLGAVDSPNLYAFVGWGPHMGRDPSGLEDEGRKKRSLWGRILGFFVDPGQDALTSTGESLQDLGGAGGGINDALTREGSSDVEEFLVQNPDSPWTSGARLPDLAGASRHLESAGRHATDAAGGALTFADRLALAKVAVSSFKEILKGDLSGVDLG